MKSVGWWCQYDMFNSENNHCISLPVLLMLNFAEMMFLLHRPEKIECSPNHQPSSCTPWHVLHVLFWHLGPSYGFWPHRPMSPVLPLVGSSSTVTMLVNIVFIYIHWYPNLAFCNAKTRGCIRLLFPLNNVKYERLDLCLAKHLRQIVHFHLHVYFVVQLAVVMLNVYL